MSRRTFRRFRPDVPIVRGSRRPVDKELIFVAQTATTSNVATTLKTTTFPCTIVGLRWSLQFLSALSTSDSTVSWIIVLVKDGNTANTISQSNGADMYTPEQNVMAFGQITVRDNDVGTGPAIMSAVGNTKTMRKMMQGDVLQFVTISSQVNSCTIRGTVQFFCKT